MRDKRFSMEIDDPESVPVRLEATLTLAEWRQVKKALEPIEIHGAAGKLRSAITDLEMKVSREFHPDPEDSDA